MYARDMLTEISRIVPIFSLVPRPSHVFNVTRRNIENVGWPGDEATHIVISVAKDCAICVRGMCSTEL